jgi:hypothetical protein
MTRASQGMAGEAPRREAGSAPLGAPSPVATAMRPIIEAFEARHTPLLRDGEIA